MKMMLEAKYLAKQATQGKKDPTKTYYSAVFLQNAETLQLSVPENIYNKMASMESEQHGDDRLKQLDDVVVFIDYNSQWKSMSVVDIVR